MICLSDDLQAPQATNRFAEGSAKNWSEFSVMWLTATHRWGSWYNGVVEGAEMSMMEWHQQEEAHRCACYAKEAEQPTLNSERGRRIGQNSGPAIYKSKGARWRMRC